MDDLRGVPLNINGDGGHDYLISVIYGNPDILDEEPLEVKGDPPCPSKGNEEGNSHTPIYLEVVVCLTFLVCYHEEIKAVIVSKNEIRTPYFLKICREAIEEEIREYSLFRNNSITSD